MSTDRQDRAAEAAKLDESYRNGFDHGRRWAAEELQRIAVREIRLQSSWLWHQLGESKLTEFCADLGRRLIAEINDPDPRTWSLPEIPVGVRLRDERDGHTWERVTDVELDGEHWTDGQAVISTGRLFQTRGRLTEVLEDNRG